MARSLPRPEFVKTAYDLIQGKVTRTPLLTSSRLSTLASALQLTSNNGASETAPLISLYFKCENYQKTGSFKYRGVMHSLARLSASELGRGLVATSSGNHATALASAAKALSKVMNQDIPVYVVMPNNASALKAHNAAALGAHVIRSGNSWLEREAAVEAIRKQYGLTLVSSSDNTNVILGQGTVGLEMAQQMEAGFSAKLDCLIVPCGGGGLLSGVGIALRNEPTKVFGAEPRDGADDCLRGLISGGRIEAVTTTTIADGLRCPVGKLPWQIIKEPSYVRGIFTASDDHICWTMALVEATMNMVIEPSAAVPLAVVLFNQDFRRYLAQQNRRMHVGVVFSGGNISKTTF